jgi:hypothetical protein
MFPRKGAVAGPRLKEAVVGRDGPSSFSKVHTAMFQEVNRYMRWLLGQLRIVRHKGGHDHK